MHDRDPIERQPELVGTHLRQHRLEPLAHVRDAAVDGGGAIVGDHHSCELARCRAEAAEAAVLHEGGDTDADADARTSGGRPELLVSDRLERAFEDARRIAALVEDRLAPVARPGVVRHVLPSYEVLPPDLGRVESQSPCGDVDQPLADEIRLEAAGTAVGSGRRLVRHDLLDEAPVGRDPVRADQGLRRDLTDPDPVRPHVGAGVEEEATAEAQDPPLGIERELGRVMLFA